MMGMELGGGDHFGQGLYIAGLDIHNVEAGLSSIHIPNVHPQVIGGEEDFPIGIDRDGMDMVGVSIGEDSLGGCTDGWSLLDGLGQA